jgi:hypothetical protein
MTPAAALLTSLLLLILGFWLGEVLRPLIPFKTALWARHGAVLAVYGAVLLLNLFTGSLLAVRALGLKGAGRKLAHLDKELRTESSLGAELAAVERQSEQ